jgi:hypothetical protein
VQVIAGGSLAPKDLSILRRWIELNLEVLVQFWNGEIEYTEDVFDRLRPIGD